MITEQKLKFRSGCSQMFFKRDILKNTKHSKTPVLESLFNKGLQACNFIKKRLQQKCFPVKYLSIF